MDEIYSNKLDPPYWSDTSGRQFNYRQYIETNEK